MIQNITDSTPIAVLTLGQLKEALTSFATPQQNTHSSNEDLKNYVYGLRGIRSMFNVSHATAQRYKDTFLRPAIIQNGRKIIVDANMARELFSENRR